MSSFGRSVSGGTVPPLGIDEMSAVGGDLAIIADVEPSIYFFIEFFEELFVAVHKLVFLRVRIDGDGWVVLHF